MDIASVKKNYIDASTNAKSNTDSASQLMGDFSAAVAKRMQGNANVGNGKNTLISSLSSKPEIRAQATPQDESFEASVSTDRPDKPAPREREEYVETRRDAPVRDDVTPNDAPREATDDRAPLSQSNDTAQSEPREGQASSEQAPEEQQAVQSSPDDGANETAAIDGQVAVVQQVNTGEVAQALSKDPTQTQTVQAAAADTSGTKQKSQKGGEAQQNAIAGQAGTEDTTEGPDFAQVEGKNKGKSTAAQAQNGTNTHVKAEAQANAEKGPTLAQQQAADLAKKVGSDQPLNVSVNVTKQSDELVSKPTATLAGPTNLKTDGESLTPTVAQAATKGQAQQAGAQNNAAGQNGGDAQGQKQQQAQLQAIQADAAKLAANTTDAKAAQNATAGNATATTKVGGAEGASASQVVAAPTAPGPAQQTQQAAAKPQVATPQQNAQTPVTEQVRVQIAKAIGDGVDKIRIQLKPAHLGRIDVQLELGQDGRVSAVITADSRDTLDLLKQDSRELERALRESGLNLDSGDLSFNMRGENGNGAGDQDVAQGQSGRSEPILEPTLDELLEMSAGQPQIISEDRIDISA